MNGRAGRRRNRLAPESRHGKNEPLPIEKLGLRSAVDGHRTRTNQHSARAARARPSTAVERLASGTSASSTATLRRSRTCRIDSPGRSAGAHRTVRLRQDDAAATLNRLTELTPNASHSGRVLLDGEDTDDIVDTELRRRVSMVFSYKQAQTFAKSAFPV